MDEAESTRDLILANAARLFAARGYDAVSVGELVEAAGVTKPSLYHWFGSKRGLLDALVGERGAAFLSAADAGAGTEADVPRGLELIAFALVRASRADPDFARLRLALSWAPPASEAALSAHGFNSTLRGTLEAWFRGAERHHGNMRGRSRAFALSFLGVLDARVGLELAGEASLGDHELRELIRQFMHGIFS
ncbi:MAG: TetR/AcrR family transcriptional regulator [Spirochaetales bacterium]|nr:TetR/AcrR family transcriptional regulator [Spirochaetales bacterium]